MDDQGVERIIFLVERYGELRAMYEYVTYNCDPGDAPRIAAESSELLGRIRAAIEASQNREVSNG